MNTTDSVAGRGLEALRAAIAGQVFMPGEAGYDQARQAWNLAVDQQPAVVVEAGSAADVTPTPDLAAVIRAQAQAVKDALAPWHATYDYYNFEETPAPARAVLPAASYRRLQKIKPAHDPGQAIISAHPAGPTRP
jgi:hypothetical protein